VLNQPPVAQLAPAARDEVTVTDLFAGAGGSSSGMIQIPGVRVAMAANHWSVACEIHNANHPNTDHSTADLHEENPAYFPKTDILWASPECTKWSQASGARYASVSMEATLLDDELMEDSDAAVAQRSRLLMFDVLRFIEHHRYRLVFIENVVDIAMRAKYSLAWGYWRRALRRLGYRFRVLSINSMHAQAFGAPAPQSRDRIYIAAWPETEKAPDFDAILRPQAYCTKCDRMVESQQAFKPGKTVGKYRDQYVYLHGACGTIVEPGYLPAAHAIDWSLAGEIIGDRLAEKTRLRIAAGIARFWAPFHFEQAGNQYDAADPKHPQHGDPNAYYRTWSFDDVIRTLHTVESKALAVPAGGTWNDDARPLSDPLRTQTTRDSTALVQPFISELYGTSTGRPVTEPAGTFTAGGNHHALVSPYYSGSDHAQPVDEPIGTLTTVDRYALVHRNNGGGAEMTTPVDEYLRTLTTAGHQSLIQAPERVRRTVTDADLAAAMDVVADCRFRMFQPHEVAAGMAFDRDYNWQPPDRAKPITKRDLVKAAGNAVCPPNARDLMAAGVTSL
jgi:DNA (cytosine-5)-methyltransferase 1